MKLFTLSFTAILLVAVTFFMIPQTVEAGGGLQVVPNVNENSQATGSFLGPLANAQRTYQMLINESELTNLVGLNINSIAFRSTALASADWPLSAVNYADYDIYLSESVAPADRSLTFANNIVGKQIQVRNGPLTIPANSYPWGGTTEFGPNIYINIPYYYKGGHLLVEIRHTGFTGTSKSVEATATSNPSYANLFSACWTGNAAGTSGTQGNFATIRFTVESMASTLNLTALIEGFYNDATDKLTGDTVKAYLRGGSSPYDIVDSAISVLDSAGNASFGFSNAVDSTPYYLVVSHRNTISTWSAATVMFSGGILNYDLTAAQSSAYGSNLKLKGTKYTMFSGDVNLDEFVNLTDLVAASNDATGFQGGYVSTDVNGDLVVNLADVVIIFNNGSSFVSVKKPA